MNDFHPAPSAAGGCFDDDGVADVGGNLLRFLYGLDPFSRPGEDRNPRLDNRLAGGDLVPHQTHILRCGADKGNATLAADLSEFGVFGEKTVTGVYRLGVGDFRGADDRLDIEIALCARSGSDADALIGYLDVKRLAVHIGVDGHGLDPHFLAGAYDAKGYLATVRYQYFMEHRVSLP